jgi:hypothetical protein
MSDSSLCCGKRAGPGRQSTADAACPALARLQALAAAASAQALARGYEDIRDGRYSTRAKGEPPPGRLRQASRRRSCWVGSRLLVGGALPLSKSGASCRQRHPRACRRPACLPPLPSRPAGTHSHVRPPGRPQRARRWASSWHAPGPSSRGWRLPSRRWLRRGRSWLGSWLQRWRTPGRQCACNRLRGRGRLHLAARRRRPGDCCQ